MKGRGSSEVKWLKSSKSDVAGVLAASYKILSGHLKFDNVTNTETEPRCLTRL